MTDQKLVLTVPEVLAALGVSRSTFNKLCRLGALKKLAHIGRRQKVSRKSVLDYVNGTAEREA